jgi:hypothetical protein
MIRLPPGALFPLASSKEPGHVCSPGTPLCLAAVSGCSVWLLCLAALSGCSVWLLCLAALSGCSVWLLCLAALSGRCVDVRPKSANIWHSNYAWRVFARGLFRPKGLDSNRTQPSEQYLPASSKDDVTVAFWCSPFASEAMDCLYPGCAGAPRSLFPVGSPRSRPGQLAPFVAGVERSASSGPRAGQRRLHRVPRLASPKGRESRGCSLRAY